MEHSYHNSEIPLAVRTLVEQTQDEFEELMARRNELSWQINKISNAIRALRAIVDLQIFPGVAHNEIFPEGLALNGIGDNDGLPDISEKNETPVSSFQLKRACRIALMESEGPVSTSELYKRILRRDSCDLSGYANPVAILTATLTSLALQGEAQLIRYGNSSYWQRILLPRATVSLSQPDRRSQKNRSTGGSRRPRKYIESEQITIHSGLN
ncbi:MAG TPA: hypothetical protein VFA74_01630 [Terriglobales bacterium]|nr:hypothetical protein [Terriglobales bacterium]